MGSYGSVLIIDSDDVRRTRLEAILSFMQLHWRSCPGDNATGLLGQAGAPICVLLGDSPQAPELIAAFPRHAFISLGALPVTAANLVGRLDELTYHELTPLLEQARRYLAPAGQEQRLHRQVVGRCAAMEEVKALLRQVADKQANVLLLGESGTGKEVIAQAIHALSQRAEGPFVPVNCGAIPAELLESELFGHEKGAFTGAVSARKGRFELAEGGTLFLDEIGDMPLPMQVKLLRVLQERTFERVGGTRPIRADVRIIAATHRDLEAMIREQRFREDLYYRLNVFPIQVPPLRERREDIPLLLEELIQRHRQHHGAELSFSPAARAALQQHDWPGNVRELSNLVERMFILYPGCRVEPEQLPARYRGSAGEGTAACREEDERDALAALFGSRDEAEDDDAGAFFEFGADEEAGGEVLRVPPLGPQGINLKEMLAGIEIELISQALDVNEGVVARAAEQLGMRRTTLVEKMKKYGISREY
ncbi:sigma-54-dependent Fis family transcriptional regulator [Zobellella denitrificans]|uniref:sigma-54 dependent transcriptional regulator n=1 Tax=Zobellella denitrificans TaxID=347534 RepID=UPI000B8C5D10|nr:sigma-54 dependent transcriptional regulator [Zobellella denitrificans]OXS14045.1 sigma-54-dependent Fis family transcriptional regulator [Zobellella denitrificans]